MDAIKKGNDTAEQLDNTGFSRRELETFKIREHQRGEHIVDVISNEVVRHHCECDEFYSYHSHVWMRLTYRIKPAGTNEYTWDNKHYLGLKLPIEVMLRTCTDKRLLEILDEEGYTKESLRTETYELKHQITRKLDEWIAKDIKEINKTLPLGIQASECSNKYKEMGQKLSTKLEYRVPTRSLVNAFKKILDTPIEEWGIIGKVKNQKSSILLYGVNLETKELRDKRDNFLISLLNEKDLTAIMHNKCYAVLLEMRASLTNKIYSDCPRENHITLAMNDQHRQPRLYRNMFEQLKPFWDKQSELGWDNHDTVGLNGEETEEYLTATYKRDWVKVRKIIENKLENRKDYE